MKKKVQIFINRFLIAINAIYCGLIRRYRTKAVSKEVVIIFQQVFGDGVILLSALAEYEKIFSNAHGYKIRLLIRPYILDFLRSVGKLPQGIEYIPIDFQRIVNDSKYFRQVVNEYCKNVYCIVVPGTSLSAELVSCSAIAERKIGLLTAIPRKWPPHIWLFQKLAYTEKIIPQIDEMMLQRHRRLVNYLGNKNFKAVLPRLVNQKRIIAGKYIVVAPGASSYVKCWQGSNFVKLIKCLLKAYKLPIYLCGGKDDIAKGKEIMKELQESDNVKNIIGKLNYANWSSLLQYATLVVGNDSATIHLAVAHRTRAICIAGVYDKYQFFPYKVDILEKNDCLPISVLKEKECSWCRTKGYFAGYGNRECSRQIKLGNPAQCISEIEVEDVIATIKSLNI